MSWYNSLCLVKSFMARRKQARPVESHDLPGFTVAIREQAEAAAQYQGEELTAKLLEPLGNISHRAGDMENDSPLFFGKVNPTLF